MPTLAPTRADTARIYPLPRRLAVPIENNEHPATGREIVPDASCGTCEHWFDRGRAAGGLRSKCALALARRGGPNLPSTTPACALYRAPTVIGET